MKKIYLDYSGSTPVDQAVLEAMKPYFSERFGNPGGLHSFGQEAMAAVDASRAMLKRLLNAPASSAVVFTGSATEGNNLVIRGTIRNARRRMGDGPLRIVTSAIEHESILETCRDLETDGVEVIYLPVTRDGIVDMNALAAALNDRTALVSIMYVNNQMGAIQPLAEIGRIIAGVRTGTSPYPLFHSDAVQGFQYLDSDVQRLGADFLTISAQKLYGPKGVGALYVRDTSLVAPVITGGQQQEFGKRSGTENVPGIVGLARAAEIAAERRSAETTRMRGLQKRFWTRLAEAVPAAELNGPTDFANRVPNNLSVYFPGRAGQDLIIAFDVNGMAVSTGAACSVRRAVPSYAIRALGWPEERAGQTIRITMGRQTTEEDVDEAVRRIKMVIEK